MVLQVQYEDDDFIAYVKPQLVHTVPGKNTDSFVERIKSEKSINDFCQNHHEAGLINRLDFETSGIVIAAKNQKTFDELRKLTKENLMEKNYIFLSHQTLSEVTACELSIGARGRKQSSVKAVLYGRDKDRLSAARTLFSPLASVLSEDIHLLEAVIYQGQRHQIRVHAKEIGCPLLNDTKYQGQALEEIPHKMFILHNIRVSLIHPITNKKIEIFAPFPEEIEKFIIGKSWRVEKTADKKISGLHLSHILKSSCTAFKPFL